MRSDSHRNDEQVTFDDVDAFVRSLFAKNTPWASGCANVLQKLWVEVSAARRSETGTTLAELRRWADGWSKEVGSAMTDGERGWMFAAREVLTILNTAPQVTQEMSATTQAATPESGPTPNTTDAKDAARYRWLRDAHDCDWNKLFRDGGEQMDVTIDENMKRADQRNAP